MPASRKSRAGIKAQNQASKQSWWVTSDAEPIDLPKSKKKSKSRKNKKAKGKPARIKINDLCYFVGLLPAESRRQVEETLRVANVGKDARKMTVRELDPSNYFAPPGAQITIRALLERLPDPELTALLDVADPESKFPADQPSLKRSAEVLQGQATKIKAPPGKVEAGSDRADP